MEEIAAAPVAAPIAAPIAVPTAPPIEEAPTAEASAPQVPPAEASAEAPASEPTEALAAATASGDWRQMLHAALMDLNLPFTADAVENSRVVEVNGELQITTTRSYKLAMREDDLKKAISKVSPRSMRIKVMIGDPGEAAAPIASPAQGADAATARALANPEVQRFQELFEGKIYKVRNLKE